MLPAAFAARAINFPILTIRVKMSHRLRDFDAIDIVARFMRELQHKPNANTQRERPRPSPEASLGPSLAPAHLRAALATLCAHERAQPAIRKATATTSTATTTTTVTAAGRLRRPQRQLI